MCQVPDMAHSMRLLDQRRERAEVETPWAGRERGCNVSMMARSEHAIQRRRTINVM